jgi:hypothetical protein
MIVLFVAPATVSQNAEKSMIAVWNASVSLAEHDLQFVFLAGGMPALQSVLGRSRGRYTCTA